MEVRRATNNDVARIREICADAVRKTYWDLWDRDYTEKTIEEFYNEERLKKEIDTYFVAEEDGEVNGCICAVILSKGIGEIYALYIDFDKRNRGIGTVLLNAVTDWMRKHGVKKQRVSVTDGNQYGLPFYYSKGFKLEKRIPTFFDPNNDMPKSLRLSRKI